MTPEQALGMLFVGVIALSIGAGVAYMILRKVYKEMHRSKRRFDDLEWKLEYMSINTRLEVILNII